MCKRSALLMAGFMLFLGIPRGLPAQIDSLNTLLRQVAGDSAKMEILNELIARTAYNDTEAALAYAQQFDSIAQQGENTERQAHALKLLGIVQYVDGDHEASMISYQHSLDLYMQLQDTFNIGMINNNIASVFSERTLYEKALDYQKRAKHWFDQTADLEWQALIVQNIAGEYEKLDRPDSALIMYEEALRRYDSPDVAQNAYAPLYRSRRALIVANLCRIYAMMDKTALAIQYGEELVNDPNAGIDQYAQMQVLNALGKSYLAAGQIDRAQQNAQASLDLAEELGNQVLAISNTEILIRVAEIRREYPRAFRLQKAFIELRDTYFDVEREKSLNELSTKYETEQKEQEIALLAASNQVKDLKIAKAQRERWLWGSGLFLVVLITGILAYFFRVNTHKNRQLAEKNTFIQKALTEKEALLREIHHRVKNNLQVISSLLSLQERRLKGQEGLRAIQESRNRVQSIALIHQNLYQQNNLSRIDMTHYFNELAGQIRSSFAAGEQGVDIMLEIDPVELDVDSVIPLGLITNELLTNALKYAFSESERGRIDLSFKKQEDGQWLLRVKDNGVGIPQEHLTGSGHSFGMKLIRIFAQKLQSTLQIDNEQGTHISLLIPQQHLKLVS